MTTSHANSSPPADHAEVVLHDAPPATLPNAPGWALFLDLDGTLCAFADDPGTVRLDAQQQDLLARLALRMGGALCVLSGRGSDDLDRALGGLVILRRGEHGRGRHNPVPSTVQAQLDAAEAALGEIIALYDQTGIWLERKHVSCAVHYRRMPQLGDAMVRAARAIGETCPDLGILEGRCVVELTVADTGKGGAVRELMQESAFVGRIPVAVGDDVTDEDAFVAAHALGGFGIAVGPRKSVAARCKLANVAAVDAWLRGLLAEHQHDPVPAGSA